MRVIVCTALSMCIPQYLCFYYDLHVYNKISMCIQESLCVYNNLYVYTIISMYIQQSLFINYNLYVYTTISMPQSHVYNVPSFWTVMMICRPSSVVCSNSSSSLNFQIWNSSFITKKFLARHESILVS